jgi:hypothetical protein
VYSEERTFGNHPAQPGASASASNTRSRGTAISAAVARTTGACSTNFSVSRRISNRMSATARR